MSGPPYQKLFWGSYHKHTGHLNHAREHGAYLLLIAALWNNEGKLPADDETLADYAKLSLKEWAAIKPKLFRQGMLRVVRRKVVQDRVTDDLAEYADTVRKRKTAGKSGGEARARKHTENRLAFGKQVPPYSKSDSESPQPPRGGAVDLKDWGGSPDILAALTQAQDRTWALTYLRHCREEGEGPFRALVTDKGWVADMLAQKADQFLRGIQVRVILREAA
jgi:uncharacterized protein YdaU (DUF1376 family)